MVPPPTLTTPLQVQRWLVRSPACLGGEDDGEVFDRYVLACCVAVAFCQPNKALDIGLGLSRSDLSALVCRYFSHAAPLLLTRWSDIGGDDPASLEEPDLRALLLEHRADESLKEVWLAHIIARRALEPNHLWQDLGLSSRADLKRLMARHFPTLSQKNSQDMKWKKFFYRELCQREGLLLCKSPVCSVCSDFQDCFGGEDGLSLLARSTHIKR